MLIKQIDALLEREPLRTRLLEPLLTSCPSIQAPQTSEVDGPAETGDLPRYREFENHSFADAQPSRGMRIEPQAEGISAHDCSRLGWLEY
jgi:hypothetical protein